MAENFKNFSRTLFIYENSNIVDEYHVFAALRAGLFWTIFDHFENFLALYFNSKGNDRAYALILGVLAMHIQYLILGLVY
ncbi:hypothetical protein BpHYR1_018989 [Brachionus plicatilis]|uniref:Uncharacterized protein n=1 Tax=Brachionus plicatilis TaxID=10195 RepID=A0A3M7T3P7_BRAPC|nr:hypothetical protein BpHYR1_018989 [Brachionus plicatilis]